MPYVDGFIVAVPKKKLAVYAALSKKCGKIWREYGALDYREWVADDVKVGKLTSFPRSVKLKPGETVVFAWITYKSRAQRDKINAKVMADPRLKSMMDQKSPPPFDSKRSRGRLAWAQWVDTRGAAARLTTCALRSSTP